jgi:glyoxylase-like metal-dependent hydrolase (beta-lactamase superfamily II)
MNIHTHTCLAPENSFYTAAHLLIAHNSAILVDAQFLRSQAQKVVALIKESSVTLESIFITHGHPDHYLGLEVISSAFPSAKILAIKEVADYIQQTGKDYINTWKPIFKNEIADAVIVPESIDRDYLELEGNRIAIIPMGSGESKNNAVLYIPSIQLLLSGDAIYNKVHLWLMEGNPYGWIENLKQLKASNSIANILPGHGEPANTSIIDENINYLNAFIDATKKASTQEEALRTMETQFPDYRLPIIADMSIKANFKKTSISV